MIWLLLVLPWLVPAVLGYFMLWADRVAQSHTAQEAAKWSAGQKRWSDIRATGPIGLPGATGDGHLLLFEKPLYSFRVFLAAYASMISGALLAVAGLWPFGLVVGALILSSAALIPGRKLCIQADGFILHGLFSSAWYKWSEVATIEPR